MKKLKLYDTNKFVNGKPMITELDPPIKQIEKLKGIYTNEYCLDELARDYKKTGKYLFRDSRKEK